MQKGEAIERTPIAVYNAQEKKLIDVFPTIGEAARYIYGTAYSKVKYNNVRNGFTNKTRLIKHRHPFPIAVRLATQKQISEFLK